MTLPVITLPHAEDEILESAQWWAKHRSPEQAQRWFDGVWDVIHSLGDQPNRWPLARENPDFPYEIHEYHFGLGSHATHRIIFTIQDAGVIVLSVYHTARDVLTPDDIPFSP